MTERFSKHPICQAEDMGGWPACDKPATLQTKELVHDRRWFYCDEHRTNRHVWHESELEPIYSGGHQDPR